MKRTIAVKILVVRLKIDVVMLAEVNEEDLFFELFDESARNVEHRFGFLKGVKLY